MNHPRVDSIAGPLKTELVADDGNVRLALTGELDLAGAASARSALLCGLAFGRVLQVDLSGLTFIDSAGLGVLVRAAQANGPDELRFLGPVTPAVGRVLTLTGGDDLLRIEAAGPVESL